MKVSSHLSALSFRNWGLGNWHQNADAPDAASDASNKLSLVSSQEYGVCYQLHDIVIH